MITELSEIVKKIATNDLDWIIDFIKQYAWAMEFIIVLAVTVVVAYFEHYIYQKVHPKLLVRKKFWEHAALHAFHRPFACFIWLMGLTFAFDLMSGYSPNSLVFRVIAPLRKTGIVLLFFWCMFSFIKEIEKLFLAPKENKLHLDKMTIRAIGQVLRIVVIVATFFIILQMTLGVGASAILAFAGGGSIVIGWAAKDMLANIFGGFMIFLDRPFILGDKICSLDKQIEGYVEHIGWRLTRIRSLEKAPIYVPNSFFSSMSIENPSRMSHRRIYTTISLKHSDMDIIPNILTDMNKILKSHPDIDLEEPVFAKLTNVGVSLDIIVYAYTTKTDLEEFHSAREQILLKLVQAVEKHGTTCAQPVVDGKLHVLLEK